MSPTSQIVPKLWNYCNVLRDDLSASDAQAGGMSYLLACAFRGSLRHADMNHKSAT
jgi:hypothetical protein